MGRRERNVRDEVPKEVGGKLASVHYHASNMILPMESLVLIDIIYNHPNMRIVCSEPATEEEQMKMEEEEECEGRSPQEGRRLPSSVYYHASNLIPSLFNHWCSFISFTIIPICVLCIHSLKNRRGADEDGRRRM